MMVLPQDMQRKQSSSQFYLKDSRKEIKNAKIKKRRRLFSLPSDEFDFEFGVDNSSVDFVGAALFAGLASVAVLGSIGTLAVGYCDIDWGD